MARETQRGVTDFLETADYNPAEDALLIVRRKAKVGIICLNAAGVPGVAVFTRSEHEKTRKNDPDWPGGTLKVDEKPKRGVEREFHQEVLGLELINVTQIAKAKRTREDIKTVTTIFLANAVEVEGVPLGFGLNDDGVPEHSAISVVAFEPFQELDAMPRKYREGLASQAGQTVLPELIETAQPLIIPPELQEARW